MKILPAARPFRQKGRPERTGFQRKVIPSSASALPVFSEDVSQLMSSLPVWSAQEKNSPGT